MLGGSFSDVEMEGVDEIESLEEKIKQVRTKLASCSDYDSHIELISLLRKNGDLDELNEERETFLKQFPMPANLWLEWIEDQKLTDSSVDAMSSLFSRCFEDFNYFKVWVECIQWASGQTRELCREKFEAALVALGLRVDNGSIIWNTYLDMEEAILSEMNGDDASVQRTRVESIFRRALRIPNLDLHSTWERYQQFAGDSIDPEIQKSFVAAQTTLSKLSKFELELAEKDDSIEVFYEYLQWEIEEGDPARVQSFFERFIEKHPLEENAWLQYGYWMEQKLKIPSLVRRVYERAVRNCSYSCVLYQQTLLALERAQADNEIVDQLWQKAKETITNADEGRCLYRSYLYLLRRRAETAQIADYTHMAKVYAEGQQVLQELFDVNWDPSHQYRRNYGWFAFDKLKDIKLAHLIWEDILASGGGRMAERWLEAVRNERQFGTVERARKLLYRALNSVSDHPYLIYEALIQFEREEGNIEQLDKALEKVNSQAAHRASRPQKKEEKSKQEHSKKSFRKDDKQFLNDRKRRGENAKQEVPAKKQALSPVSKFNPVQKDKDGFTMPGLPLKKAEAPFPKLVGPVVPSSSNEGQEKNAKGGDKKFTVFVSNLDFKCSEDAIKEALSPGVVDVQLFYRGMSKLHKGYGYVDMDGEKNYEAALKKDRVQINGRPMYVNTYNVTDRPKNSAFKYSTGLEKNKLFVKHVHYDCTKEQLQEVFEQFGAVSDIRIVTHKSGKSKGVAYVDMSSDEAAQKALDAGEIILLGRKLSVFLSDPPKKNDSSLPSDMEPLDSYARKGHLQLVPRMARLGANKSDVLKPSNGAPVKMTNDQFRSLLSGGK